MRRKEKNMEGYTLDDDNRSVYYNGHVLTEAQVVVLAARLLRTIEKRIPVWPEESDRFQKEGKDAS